MSKGLSNLEQLRIVSLVMILLISSKAFWLVSVLSSFCFPFPTRSVSGAGTWLLLLHVSLKKYTIPKKLLRSFRVVGYCRSGTAWTFFCTSLMPSLVSKYPISSYKKDNFLVLTLNSTILRCCITLTKCWRCSSKHPLLMISRYSKYIQTLGLTWEIRKYLYDNDLQSKHTPTNMSRGYWLDLWLICSNT